MQKITPEMLAVRRALFVDYCNVREQALRKGTQLTHSEILVEARTRYRHREVERNAKWFKAFKARTTRRAQALDSYELRNPGERPV